MMQWQTIGEEEYIFDRQKRKRYTNNIGKFKFFRFCVVNFDSS